MNSAIQLTLAVGMVWLLCMVPAAVMAEAGSVGGKPANPRPDNPRTQSIFVHEIAPGEEKADAVIISNNTSEEKQIELYATDAQIASGGAFACEQKADKPDQEGPWLKLDKNLITLEGNKSETVGFTIDVPKNASVGEHNACIAIQSLEKTQAINPNNGVRLSFRSAIRVAITVPGDLKKRLSFESFTVDRNIKGEVAVHQTLRNQGNVSLDTNLETAIRTAFGNKIASDGGEFPVLSGQRAEFNFAFKRPLWGGWYRIIAAASYDKGSQTSLGEKSNEREIVQKSTWVFVVPHWTAALLYVLVLGGVAAAVIWRRRSRQHITQLRERSVAHTVVKGDDITSISSQYGADWKQTAKLNGLKPPYSVLVGKEVLVAPSPDYVPPTPNKKPRAKNAKKSIPKSKSKTSAPKKQTAKAASAIKKS